MLSIQTNTIEKNIKTIKLNLNYPIINEEENNKKTIKYINKKIYQDIIAFGDVVNEELSNVYAITEYKVTFNKNYIISIPIEFSQLIGLHDITHINSYNYDMVLNKELSINNIFKKNINLIYEITQKIKEELNYILNKYYKENDNEEDIKINLNNIEKNHPFYIEPDGVIICFASYELSEYVSQPMEFKVYFSEHEEHLSEYTINNIWKINKNI